MAAALALLLAANIHAACAVELLDSPGGERLARLPLPADRGFALRYTHSVTLRPVESRYVVRADRIVQTAEVFDEHGPGMATDAGPGERLDRQPGADGARFVLSTQRPLPRLVVRLHPVPAFRLLVGQETIDLAQWGARAVEIRADCPGPAEAGHKAAP
jgi:hypothetical protein